MANGKKSSRSEIFTSPADDLWRGAYPMLHTPRTKSWDNKDLLKPQYDIQLVVPKRGTAENCPNYRMLGAMLMQAATKEWGSWPQGAKWPIKDGDDPPKPPAPGAPPVDPNKNLWKKGHWIVSAKAAVQVPPKVAILQNGAPVEIAAQTLNGKQYYKSGDFGVFQLQAYTYNEGGNFGVSVGIVMAMWVREGEAIGGAERSVAQAFGGIAAGLAASGVTGMHPNAPQYSAPAPTTTAPQSYVPTTAPVPPPGYASPPMPPSGPPPQYSAPAPNPAPVYAAPAPPSYAPPAGPHPQYSAPAGAPSLPPFPR